MKMSLGKNVNYDQLKKLLLLVIFVKQPFPTPSKIKGKHTLEFHFPVDEFNHTNQEELLNIFKQFINIYHIIIFKKIKDFAITHTKNNSYEYSIPEEQEEIITNNLLRYVTSVIGNKSDKTITLLTSISVENLVISVNQQVLCE